MTTRMTKGSQTIYVAASLVAQHEALGWKQGPTADVGDGVLKVGGTAVKASAAALNALDLPVVGAGTLVNAPVRHYQITPALHTATYVHAASNLLATAQTISTGVTNPDYPRTLTAKGSVTGVAGNVVITGTNILGEVITDSIALSGASEIEGIKAFATVTGIALPAESHAHAAQVETATVVGTITLAGNATVIVTCTGMTGSPKTFNVAVALNDTAAQVAAKIIAALAADSAVTALFSVGGTGADIVLTKLTVAANITNLNISTDNGTCTGLTTESTSANTVPGVAYDTVSVGVGSKFGIPQIAYNASCLLLALFNASADAGGTLAVDDDEVEKNLYSIAGTADGAKLLDLYYMA
jgi:hypothetical protein